MGRANSLETLALTFGDDDYDLDKTRGEESGGWGGNKGAEEKTKKVREWIVELALKQSVRESTTALGPKTWSTLMFHSLEAISQAMLREKKLLHMIKYLTEWI